MKKLLFIFIILLLLNPLFPALNKHGYVLFEDWIYNDYNNEGTWIIADFGAYVSNKQSLVRMSMQITDKNIDGSEYVSLSVREYNGNYRTNYWGSTNYNNGDKIELQCYTDDDGIIEYKIEYGQSEIKKVKVKIVLENSIN